MGIRGIIDVEQGSRCTIYRQKEMDGLVINFIDYPNLGICVGFNEGIASIYGAVYLFCFSIRNWYNSAFARCFFMKMGAPPKKQWIHLIVLGILQTAIVFLLVMYGLSFVGAGKSSVLLYSMPIWSSILAVKFLNEKITGAKMIGLGLGMVGLFMILGWDLWEVGS